MRLKLVAVCLLLILSTQAVNSVSFSQTLTADKSTSWTQVQERINRVENGLLPPFLIKGEPVSPMNLADRMKHYNVKGVSVAVINNGQIEWAKGFGVRDTDAGLPVTVDTVFQAGSVSKPVAAMAALKMVQNGKLSLDEDVNLKLVSWKMPENEFTKEQKVTLRGLLSHSAGTSIWDLVDTLLIQSRCPAFLRYSTEARLLTPKPSAWLNVRGPSGPIQVAASQ